MRQAQLPACVVLLVLSLSSAAAWEACSLRVFGEEGAAATLVEHPSDPAADPPENAAPLRAP